MVSLVCGVKTCSGIDTSMISSAGEALGGRGWRGGSQRPGARERDATDGEQQPASEGEGHAGDH